MNVMLPDRASALRRRRVLSAQTTIQYPPPQKKHGNTEVGGSDRNPQPRWGFPTNAQWPWFCTYGSNFCSEILPTIPYGIRLHSLGAISERTSLRVEVHLIEPEPRTVPCKEKRRHSDVSKGGPLLNHSYPPAVTLLQNKYTAREFDSQVAVQVLAAGTKSSSTARVDG